MSRSIEKTRARVPLPLTVLIFAAAFWLPALPWLSGAVTIPWDAKSQFFPAVQFLATSIVHGEWPWWTSNVFAGWPLICDPQSLLFSPLHVLLAFANSDIGLRSFDAVTFVYLFLGGVGILLFFHDRGWDAGGALVAAIAFTLGGSASARIQHTTEVISLSYLPLTLWLLGRTLERGSWGAALAAGVSAGLLALRRDQVALLSLYALAGYVLMHWMGRRPLDRIRASIAPLTAAGVIAVIIAAYPVIATVLFTARSNRPEIAYAAAAPGSLHPVHFLQFVFADLYGAMRSNQNYWAPQSLIWDAAWGSPGLYLSQNMGLLYAGALTIAVVLSFGLIRALAWTREIRFFSIATFFVLLYALGGYTPAFRLMYEAMPGVKLFRRPADASFVLAGLIAIIAGYLVHRWLTDRVPPATYYQRMLEAACPAALIAGALFLAHSVVGISWALVPVLTAIIFTSAAVAVLWLCRRLKRQSPAAAAALLAAFMAADLAWNNAPHVSTALAPERFESLLQETSNETVRFLKAKLAASAAPDRRDRVELIGIDYHWPNLSLAQGFDHVFGHNPLRLRSFYEATHVGDTVALASQRAFSPLYPSYHSAFADLLGVRFIATGVPVDQIDSSLKAGDLKFLAHTKDAYIYENPRALPRVMLITQWQLADFAEVLRSGWPDIDPRRTVLLEHAPAGFGGGGTAPPGSARLLKYANTEVLVEVNAPGGGILLLNDVWDPWWRAAVDGAKTEILAANVIFRGVVVPAGRHVVHFTFNPFAGALDELRSELVARVAVR